MSDGDRAGDHAATPAQQGGGAAPSGDKGGQPSGDNGGKQPHWSPPPSRIRTVVVIVLGVVLVIAILAIWRLPPFEADGPDTDNAYVRGRVTTIAPEVSGYVQRVFVRDYEQVRRGQPLVQIDDASYAARVEQARADVAARESERSNNRQGVASARATLQARRATLASALAQRDRAATEYRRTQALVGDGSVSRRERDDAYAAYRSAQASVAQASADVRVAQEGVRTEQVSAGGLDARVEQARAVLKSALIDLARTRIVAPSDGQVGPVDTHVGRFVAAGAALFTLVPPERWVVAEYKEREVRGIQVGQPASFSVDAIGGDRFRGVVERIAPATGSEFAAIKPDNGTGNFVKVPQRIGVRVAIYRNQSRVNFLRPGMSVEMTIDTTGARAGDHQVQTADR